MRLIIGYAIVFGSVIGGYLMAHGKLLALWQPAELVIIGGGALGAFVVANSGKVIKDVFRSLPALMKGSVYNKPLAMDVLALMYELFTKSRKEGLMVLEADVDEPHSSEVFTRYPKVLADHHLMEFIRDYLRLMVGGSMNPYELEQLMDAELDTHHTEQAMSSSAVQTVSDALPGFGIVAAVMGIVITMASLGGPVEELGAHVAAALVGTFLGILLSYGVVGPIAAAITEMNSEQAVCMASIKVCILATLNGYAPPLAIEFGRKTLFSNQRPSFSELEDHVRSLKK